MDFMASRDAFGIIYHDKIWKYSVSTHDIHKETTIRSKSLSQRKGRETRSTSEEIMAEHLALGVKTE